MAENTGLWWIAMPSMQPSVYSPGVFRVHPLASGKLCTRSVNRCLSWKRLWWPTTGQFLTLLWGQRPPDWPHWLKASHLPGSKRASTTSRWQRSGLWRRKKMVDSVLGLPRGLQVNHLWVAKIASDQRGFPFSRVLWVR